jgi:ribonucleoside-triphosphate reductase
MKIIKRSGTEVVFDIDKIVNAIRAANLEVEEGSRLTDRQVVYAAQNVAEACENAGHTVSVEEIQDLVEDEIMRLDCYEVARHYIIYRYVQSLKRQKNTTDDKILSLIECNNEEVKQENSNKNPTVNSVQRDYMAGEISKDLTQRVLLPQEIVDAHNEGLIHFHDSDYFAQHMHNCDLVNLEDMLQNGTVISGTLIEKPHSFSTACNIATQIIAQVASSQYGGQSISLTHLAPFVEVSRQKIRGEVARELEELGVSASAEKVREVVEDRLRDEIRRGVQTIQYQVVTLMTTNGQAPFVTVFMYLNEARTPQEKHDLAMIVEETLRQRYEGVKNEAGVWITPAFPKLIYVLEDDNVHEDSPYFYLTQLAAKCTAKRMVPDYISEKKMRELKLSKGETAGNGDCYTCMGCRSFLTPDRSGNGFNNVANALNYDPTKPKYYGRFNQGVVTINLPDVALSSHQDMDKFWKIFDERLELCHRALLCRHERLMGTLSDAAPILWQYGALARLKKGETIDKLLVGGYSTISLGYAGLYECVKYMTGHSHTEKEGTPFAMAVMQRMNDKCAEWKAASDIDFSLYGTPLESTTYKFAKCLQRRFGIIPGVTDKGYITNSYHVHVSEKIDAFDKLKFEGMFQQLSPGGAISYVEVPNMQDNLKAVIRVMQYIYDNIMYAELNTKSDYCQVCGYDGEIKIVEDDGKLVWECPNCGNRDQEKMNVPPYVWLHRYPVLEPGPNRGDPRPRAASLITIPGCPVARPRTFTRYFEQSWLTTEAPLAPPVRAELISSKGPGPRYGAAKLM